MPLIVNLRQLARETLVLQGQLSVAELDLDLRDDMIQVCQPTEYDLAVEMTDGGILVQGGLHTILACECVRCLKKFTLPLNLDGRAWLLPVSGEDAVVFDNENADLTPLLREDMILEFPQHPLCKPDCAGLKKSNKNQVRATGENPENGASAWAELNKLKL